MNVALYHPWIKGKGGIEKLVLQILKLSSHDITLFTLFYDSEETFEEFQEFDIRVLGSNSPPKGFFDKALRFGIGSLLVNLPLEDFDRLLVSEAGLGCLSMFRNHNVPAVCYCHTPLRPALGEFRKMYRKEIHFFFRPFFDIGVFVYNFLERISWKHFSSVIANSELTKGRIVEKKLFPADDVHVVNPGVDVDDFRPGEFQDYFLYPSRFRRYKRQDLAIKSFKKANLEDFSLILAGYPQEEDYMSELESIIGEDDNIEILTDLNEEEWSELYRNAYSIIFLAKNEDWGMVPLEAMAAGKPVVAVNEGGFVDAIRDGETGFLVNPTPEEIANKLEWLVQHEKKAKEMGALSRKTVDNYSWDNFMRKFDENIALEGV